MPRPAYSNAKSTYEGYFLSAYMNGEEILTPQTAELQEPDLQKIFNDPVAAHAYRYLKTQVAGVGREIVAASSDKKDQDMRAYYEEILNETEDLVKTHADLTEHSIFGKCYAAARFGYRWVRMPGKKKSALLSCPYQIRHISRNRVREFWDRKNKRTLYKVFDFNENDHIPVDPRSIIRITESEAEHHFGSGGGIAQPLLYSVSQKQKIEKEGHRLAERIGTGFMSLTLSEKHSLKYNNDLTKVNRIYKDIFEKMKARHIAALLAGDQIQFHEPGSIGWEVLNFLLSYHVAMIRILLVGSTLPIDAGDTSNSFALAKVQENSSWTNCAFIRYNINEAFTHQLFRQIYLSNIDFWKQENLYRARWPEYKIKEGRLRTPGISIQEAEKLWAMGLPLPQNEVYARVEWPMPAKGDKLFINPEFRQSQRIAPEQRRAEDEVNSLLNAA